MVLIVTIRNKLNIKEEVMKMNSLLIMSIIIYPILVFSNTNWDNIYKTTNYLTTTPFAVRYKILDKNHVGENIINAIKEGYFPSNYNPPFCYTYLTGECIYLNDAKGGERFQYTEVCVPEDIIKYKDFLTTHTISLTHIGDITYKRYQNKKGKWEPVVVYMDSDYLSKISASQFRFPFFGMAISSKENEYGFKNILDILSLNKPQIVNSANTFKEIEMDINEFNLYAKIEFFDEGIPSMIFMQNKDGRWNSKQIILEKGLTSNGYIYPQKARIERSLDNRLLQETTIEIEEMIIGPQALDKYPLLLPAPDEVKIIDDRTKKN